MSLSTTKYQNVYAYVQSLKDAVRSHLFGVIATSYGTLNTYINKNLSSDEKLSVLLAQMQAQEAGSHSLEFDLIVIIEKMEEYVKNVVING